MNPVRVSWGMSGAVWLVMAIMCCVYWGWPAIGITVLFGLVPDLPLIGGFIEKGRLNPNRVKLYNTLHVTTIPVAMLVLGIVVLFLTGGFDTGFWPLALAGVAWFVHIAADRAFGFGLRDADGSMLPVGVELR